MPNANPDLLELLASMLRFNPYFRVTAQEALKSKVFDDIRVAHFEKTSHHKIQLELYEDGAYDYKNHTDHMLRMKDLRKTLAKEMKKVKLISPLFQDNQEE